MASIKVSVYIKAPAEKLFPYLTDIENMSEFFPFLEFKTNFQGPPKAGDTYESSLVLFGTKSTSLWRIVELENNRRMAGEQVTGFLKKARFDHRFRSVEGGTMSEEVMEYELPFGLFGKMLDILFLRRMSKSILYRTHMRLKEKAETI